MIGCQSVKMADSNAKEERKDASAGCQAPPSMNSSLFYGVCLPTDDDESSECGALVFSDKMEALQTVKKHKGARFKVFSSQVDAANFSRQSCCSTPKSTSEFSFQDSPELFKPSVGEKASAFKAPRSQEMVKLRKKIECGDAEYFTKMVWSNPRYLVSCGDTPAILQEGFRYNALHVSAKHNQSALCALVLATLEDPKFLTLMYNEDTPQVSQQRREYIIDLYLNMPEKGLCETPLHFACKFGCVKVVEVLLAHPVCNIQRQNKYGKTAREVICERNGNAEIRRQMELLFEAMYYVPVLRSDDNSVQGVVGRPYSMVEQSKQDLPHQGQQDSSLVVNPSLVVKAKAGPMTFKQAELFYKKWRSCLSSTQLSRESGRNICRSDSRKGLERLGRCLAREFKVPWSEQWSFLGCWADLSSTEGLQKLEFHLRELYYKAITGSESCDHDSSIEEPDPSSETSKALSPISLLCRQLEGFHLNGSRMTTSPDTPALFGLHSDSESSVNSSQRNTSALNSPCLRYRPGFTDKQYKNLNFMSSTPAHITGNSSVFSSDYIRKKMEVSVECRSSPRISPSYFEQMSSSIVAFICDCVNDSDDNQSQSSSESVILSFKQFLSISQRFNRDILAEFHSDVAKVVVNRLQDDLHQYELVLAVNKCCVLVTKNNNNDDSSSDDELPSWNNRTQRIKFKKHILSRKHLTCVLNQIKDLLENCIDCELKCHCSWGPFVSKDAKAPAAKTSQSSNPDESSEDEFHTPPGSSVGSPLSSIGEEVFTPDEGIRIFIQGVLLSKSDVDVRNALEDVVVDPVLYPHLYMWKQALESCTKDEINNLMTPVSGRRLSLGACGRQSEPPRAPQMIDCTPDRPIRRAGSRTAPHRMVNTPPTSFYDCLLHWDETPD